MKSRRKFIHDCALLGAVIAAPWPAFSASEGKALRGGLTLEAFTARMSRVFRAGAVELELVEARRSPVEAPASGQSWETFVLGFRGPQDKPLGQGTHAMEEEVMGNFPLFIVPEKSTDRRFLRYAAVFNVPAGRTV